MVTKPKQQFIPPGVDFILSGIEKVVPTQNEVVLSNGQTLPYDFLIIATGSHPRPEETPGMTEEGWQKTIFDFYTYDGAMALQKKLADWQGGRLLVSVMELPYKCPVAPLEFVFLADWYFQQRGIRDKMENFLDYITGKPMTHSFDGHANCFVETGFNQAILIDFNYTVEPLPGKFPLPGIGPFSLSKESHTNHWGKMSFRWFYWNILLKGVKTPLPAHMSMSGKKALTDALAT